MQARHKFIGTPLWDRNCRALSSGCFQWLGNWKRQPGRRAYAEFYWRGKRYNLARVIAGAQGRERVIRVCGYPYCINPAHLKIVSWRELCQLYDSSYGPGKNRLQQLYCCRGHSLEGARVQRRKDGRAFRICVHCERERKRKYRKAKEACATNGLS